MARYKYYDYNQTVVIAIELEKQILPGTLEYAIHKIVEERVKIDLFEKKLKNDETGRPAYDPKVMLKIILLSYSKGIITSRKIEAACKENILFMALSGRQSPDHSKIAEFISTMKEEIQPLFRDILLVCDELKLLGGTSFALDGSNASKHWSGTHAELQRKKEKLEEKISKLIKDHQAHDKKENLATGGGERTKEMAELKKIRKKSEKIDRWLKDNEVKQGKRGKEVKSNITDNESCKMSTSSELYKATTGKR